MLAAIYCRVSTSGQAENGTSLESQRDACLDLAAERGYTVQKEHVFAEDWSGADLERPKLERARELVRSSAVQALICYGVDRLARDPIHIGIVAEECAKREAELLFVVEPLDNSPEGALIRYVKGYAAQIERERIKERTLRGKRTRARMGFMVQATGPGMYGYRYIPEAKKREIYEPEAQVVRRIFDACLEGNSCYSIAVALNQDGIPTFAGSKWHPASVKRLLTNTAYKGLTTFGKQRRIALGGKRYRLENRAPEEWIEIPGASPAIVSEEVFDLAQNRLSRPKRTRTNISGKYLLTGFIQCSCGSPAVGTRLSHVYRYYRCRGTWSTTIRPKTCNQPYIKADPLEEAAWKTVEQLLENPELVLKVVEESEHESAALADEAERLRGSIKRLAEQERRLIGLYGLEKVTQEFVTREVDQVKRSREALESELAQLEEMRKRTANSPGLSERIRAYCTRVKERAGSFDFDSKREAMRTLQIKVVVDRDHAILKGALLQDLATIEQTSA